MELRMGVLRLGHQVNGGRGRATAPWLCPRAGRDGTPTHYCPAVPSPHHELFAVDESGPSPLAMPQGLASPALVFDDLPAGVYEALRTFDHDRFVGLEAHLDRAQRSIRHFGMSPTLGSPAVRSALHTIATGFAGQDAKIRIDFLADAAITLGTDCRVIALASELKLPAPEIYAQGVSCELVGQLRRGRPEIKESSWVVDRRPAEGGTPSNYESVLVSPEGLLLEGVMSNFFVVRDGEVLTAPENGVLPGVTRGIVLDLVRGLGLPCSEQPIHQSEIGSLQEAFFSTSVRSIVPVVKLDGTILGSGAPGPVTRQVMEVYGDYCRSEARPAESDA